MAQQYTSYAEAAAAYRQVAQRQREHQANMEALRTQIATAQARVRDMEARIKADEELQQSIIEQMDSLA